MKTSLHFSLPPGPLRVGLVEASGVTVKPSSPAYVKRIEEEVKPLLQPDWIYPDHLQKGIRSLLKAYGFHPSGRNRPASEFLVKDLQARGRFNAINNAVDINNHLSLQSHLPISILDLDKTGDQLCIRVGLDEEHYVFNREGQDLALKKLLVTARAVGDFQAVGSPVKDSQETKISEATGRLVGIVYTSATITSEEELGALLRRFADLLRSEAGATATDWTVLDSPL
jgi:DNA/RNA-binding domain of Phe-tRNA-synthetase-like protein